MTGLALSWRMARRELRGGVRGFRFFLACLMLGVAAIAAVGTLSAAILTSLDKDASTLLGGDVSITVSNRDIDPAQRAWLDRNATTSRIVAMRTMAHGGNDRRSLAELKAVDSAYPLYGALELDPAMTRDAALARRNGTWGAAVEPSLMQRLHLTVGDTIRIGETDFEVRAAIAREPDYGAGSRGPTLGPRVLVSINSLADTKLIMPGSLVTYGYRVRLPETADADGWVERLNAAFPQAGWRVRQPEDAAPRVRRLVERTVMFLVLIGLTTLLAGGVGIGNAVRSFLATKTATIATMKCLGAPARLIMTIYLLQILVMALIGTALGVAVGAAGAWGLTAALSAVLPVAIGFSLHAEPLALAAVFGMLTAIAFSLWPLGRACEIAPAGLFRDLVAPARSAPRAAFALGAVLAGALLAVVAILTAADSFLASWFIGGAVIALVLFAATGWLVEKLARRLTVLRPARLRLAIANLGRPGAPTATVFVSLGLGLTVLVAVALIEGNLARLARDTLPDRAPGVFFIDIQPDQVAPFDTAIKGIKGVAEIRRLPMLRGRVTAINGTPAEEYAARGHRSWLLRGDRGISWTTEPPPDTELVEGEWWPADYRGKPLVSLDARGAHSLGVHPGDTITVNILGRNITAEIANLRLIDWRSLSLNFSIIFAPGTLEGAPQTHIAALRATRDAEAAAERAVTDRFANVTAISVRQVLEALAEMVGRIADAVRAAAALTVLAGALVLGGAIAADHRRRVYDAVILKVLGATRRNVLAVFTMEYGVIALVTAGFAAVLGTIAARLVVVEVMRMDFTFLAAPVIGTALVGALVTVGLGFAGIWRALGHKAAPLLRNA